MLLERLTVTDVGTFKGLQEFDLVPRVRYGYKRPVILFGGLNGAGKTTFMTAIRLALYGRQALEPGTTFKDYEQFLRDLIHRPKHSLVRPTKASVTLELVHARFGKRTKYKIVRTWEIRGKESVDERLSVAQDDETIANLVDDQAQALLLQLIPVGVAQFFFFDGERIASIAKDDSDVVLADSIRRLLGLDLAERLDSDLSVYLRQLRASRASAKAREEIAELQDELDQIEQEVQQGLAHLDQVLNPALNETKLDYERRRAELTDRGGAWAVNRNVLEAELDKLREQRVALEHQLRDQLNGVAVFSLAPKLCLRISTSLQMGQKQLERELLAKSIGNQIAELKNRIASLKGLSVNSAELSKCVDGWAQDLLTKDEPVGPLVNHGLVASEARIVGDILTRQTTLRGNELVTIYKQANDVAKHEDSIQERLAMAPSEDSLKDALVALTEGAQMVGRLVSERRAFIEVLKHKTWASIDLVRKLKKVEGRVVQEDDTETGEQIAASVQLMIDEFRLVAAKEKCEVLRQQFLTAFLRLARKDDIVHDVKIDPQDFKVTLLDRAEREVPKKQLSAGEKQIYAIAMLEALGKTAGRSLPVIIDTPLGRLDSKHRTKLVDAYFPVASHQVILLSTDTEIDVPFYEGLKKHISHAYHLSFSSEEGATSVEDGYFWQHEQEQEHAA